MLYYYLFQVSGMQTILNRNLAPIINNKNNNKMNSNKAVKKYVE